LPNCRLNDIYFFLNKGIALPYHIRRRSSSFTSKPKLTPPHMDNAHEQYTRQGTTPPPPGRRAEEAVATCVVVTNAVSRPKPRPSASRTSHPNPFHHGLSPTSRTHTVAKLSTPTLLRQKTLVAALMKTADPDHSAWGPPAAPGDSDDTASLYSAMQACRGQ
jgi:hypothetical protein